MQEFQDNLGKCEKFKDLPHAKVFRELKDHHASMAQFKDYMRQVDEYGTGLFLSVCRGKLSEGFNFSDQYARALFMIGIPYQKPYDPRVYLKRKQMDSLQYTNQQG